jgi:hypothetical protein
MTLISFVDGHHEQAATLDYVARLSAHLSPRALIILDDIYLYEGMWRAWQTLSSAGNVIAINIGRFGLLVRDGSETGRLTISPATPAVGAWEGTALTSSPRPRRKCAAHAAAHCHALPR